MSHTSGLWKVEEYGGGFAVIGVGIDPRIAYCYAAFAERTKAEAEANARLIARSPRLLWALKQIIQDLPAERKDWLDPSLEAEARAIIQEAEGRKVPA